MIFLSFGILKGEMKFGDGSLTTVPHGVCGEPVTGDSSLHWA
jgi:hypothetical protein